MEGLALLQGCNLIVYRCVSHNPPWVFVFRLPVSVDETGQYSDDVGCCSCKCAVY